MTISSSYTLALSRFKEEECAVCLDEFGASDPIYLLACEHLFHPDCLTNQKLCPNCRMEIRPFVTKLASGYEFYNLLYQLITQHENKNDWTPKDIETVVHQLTKAASTHHEWNNHIKLQTFNHLCFKLGNELPSDEESQAIESFFQDVIQHPDFQKISAHLEQQFLSLRPQEESTLWNLITRVAFSVACIPYPDSH